MGPGCFELLKKGEHRAQVAFLWESPVEAPIGGDGRLESVWVVVHCIISSAL